MKSLSKADCIKAGTIPILLGVLYCVLPSNESETNSLAKVDSQPKTVQGGRVDKSEAKQSPSLTKWPVYHFNDLGDTDPFDRRVIFPEAAVQVPESETNSVGKRSLVTALSSIATPRATLKVQAVFQSPQGIAALVGERIVRIGDRLEDGSEIVGITPEQVVLDSKATY